MLPWIVIADPSEATLRTDSASHLMRKIRELASTWGSRGANLESKQTLQHAIEMDAVEST
jgi:hypothetical protein